MVSIKKFLFIRVQRLISPNLSSKTLDHSSLLRFRPMSTSATTVSSSSSSQVPRPSASLVIVNERNEILLVHRNPQARHFGGVHVRGSSTPDSRNLLGHRCSREAISTRSKTLHSESLLFGKRLRNQGFCWPPLQVPRRKSLRMFWTKRGGVFMSRRCSLAHSLKNMI